MSRSFFKRRNSARSIEPKFLIACEGDSEENYIEAIRRDLRLSKDRVIVLNEKGTDPLSIVRTAIEAKEDLQRDNLWLPQDTVWVALDGDEHRDNDRDNWHQALDLAQAKSVQLALSNPSLELWYLLHYQNQEAYIHRDKAAEELEGHLPSYKKPMGLYPVPPDMIAAAIQRAARLAHRNEENGLPFHNNPCSGMGRLVESLLRLRR